ncbi:hypothetical protein [Dehalobacter sp.]|uniref:hypothetical protein n=1 Tax=Dehalobacter sp. TaxID=1962289 RepID=UPI002590DCAA|nr:hypothetical protein [Dehalobacter sp.]MDJ0304550.1 hypothetical protein [Dehalobacter sp.]
MTGVFTGLTMDLGVEISDVFAGAQLFVAQFWPLIALAIAIPVGFGLGKRLIRLGKSAH